MQSYFLTSFVIKEEMTASKSASVEHKRRETHLVGNQENLETINFPKNKQSEALEILSFLNSFNTEELQRLGINKDDITIFMETGVINNTLAIGLIKSGGIKFLLKYHRIDLKTILNDQVTGFGEIGKIKSDINAFLQNNFKPKKLQVQQQKRSSFFQDLQKLIGSSKMKYDINLQDVNFFNQQGYIPKIWQVIIFLCGQKGEDVLRKYKLNDYTTNQTGNEKVATLNIREEFTQDIARRLELPHFHKEYSLITQIIQLLDIRQYQNDFINKQVLMVGHFIRKFPGYIFTVNDKGVLRIFQNSKYDTPAQYHELSNDNKENNTMELQTGLQMNIANLARKIQKELYILANQRKTEEVKKLYLTIVLGSLAQMFSEHSFQYLGDNQVRMFVDNQQKEIMILNIPKNVN